MSGISNYDILEYIRESLSGVDTSFVRFSKKKYISNMMRSFRERL